MEAKHTLAKLHAVTDAARSAMLERGQNLRQQTENVQHGADIAQDTSQQAQTPAASWEPGKPVSHIVQEMTAQTHKNKYTGTMI